MKNNAIVGKELKVNFMDSYFGNPDNDPVLKGRGATSDDQKTKIYKVAFTTCNTVNKNALDGNFNQKNLFMIKKESI